jgi:hypothetical protein
LNTGAIYYLSKTTAGAWTTTAPTPGDWEVPLGIAISATEFLFEPGYISFQRTEATEDTEVGTAGEALSQYDVVYCDYADGGKWKKAQNDGTVKEANATAIVIASGGISNGSTGLVQFVGKISNVSWSWTPGKDLYVDATAGALTESDLPSTASSGTNIKPCGFAITATKIWFNPQTGYTK